MKSFRSAGFSAVNTMPSEVKTPEGLAILDWVRREFDANTRRLNEPSESRYTILYEEPGKPREGQVVYADGTDWNPGQGAGVYVYSGSAWTKASLEAADVLALLLTVDGPGSGLDADTLDGYHAAMLMPVGTVTPYAGTSAPTGWLFCFGQNVSRTTYAALFTAIGTTYGVGDGSTTFGIPDLRGRAIAGKDDMGGTSANRLTSPINGDNLGAAGGSESHTLTLAQLPAHSHPLPEGVSGTPVEANPGARFRGGYTNAVATSGSSTGTGNAGSGNSHNNVQPTIVLNYMIFAGV